MNAPLNPHNWQLIGLTPALGDLSITVGTSLSIGRSDNNDVVLASPQVSRQHAKINRIGDKLYLQDLGSANGTFINGERVGTEATLIQANDELAFADILFTLDNSADHNHSIVDDVLEPISSSPTEIIAPVEEALAHTVIHAAPTASDNDEQKIVQTYQTTSLTNDNILEPTKVSTDENVPVTTNTTENIIKESPSVESGAMANSTTHPTKTPKKTSAPIIAIIAIIILFIIIAISRL